MDDDLREQIDTQVKSKRVMLFMKGTPAFPQCGFSNQAIRPTGSAAVTSSLSSSRGPRL